MKWLKRMQGLYYKSYRTDYGRNMCRVFYDRRALLIWPTYIKKGVSQVI